MAPGLQKGGTNEEMALDRSPAANARVFKQFDIVTDCSDHYFLWSNNPSKDGVSCDRLKIMQEWKILKKNLPESIYVRAYEERIDLLRAVIIGAAGTPYHDSLFFFDFAFPSDYPNQPPKVYYHSHNLHLNPNLYAGGYVCLSLLNTWVGNKTQKWNPSESTVLQVLVSLQALVLNEKPYFNEPGVSPGGKTQERESMSYNEDVFLLSCNTMLCSLRTPPRNFEGFVAEHFGGRGDVILAACRAYTEGRARVGYFYVDEGPSSGAIKVTSEFEKSMESLYLDLDAAFAKNSAQLATSSSRKTGGKSSGRATVRRKKHRARTKFIGKMKWMLGLRRIIKKSKKRGALKSSKGKKVQGSA